MKIIFACGGSGGDIFPAVAVAQALVEREKDSEIVFVGTKQGLEREIIGKTPWRLEMIETTTFADKKGLRKAMGLVPFFKALGSTFRLLQKERPNAVIGVGNYVAAPVLIMAGLLKLPTLSIEPNAIPGLANRLIKYFVEEIVVAYPEMEKYFGKKTRLLGVPVRKDLIMDAFQTYPSEKKVVLVFGGSLGAKKLNEGILASLPFLTDWKDKIHFIHQVGSGFDPKPFSHTYQQYGFSHEVYPFIEKMGLVYGKAALVIARAGGNTIAELVALQKPALLIPYPFARGGHQERNARSLERMGGAKVLLDQEVTGEKLADWIRELFSEPEVLKKMQKNLANLERREATEAVVTELLGMVKHV